MVRSFYQRARGSGTALFLDSDEALRNSLRDLTGDYALPLYCFAGLAVVGVAAALVARKPRAAGGPP